MFFNFLFLLDCEGPCRRWRVRVVCYLLSWAATKHNLLLLRWILNWKAFSGNFTTWWCFMFSMLDCTIFHIFYLIVTSYINKIIFGCKYFKFSLSSIVLASSIPLTLALQLLSSWKKHFAGWFLWEKVSSVLFASSIPWWLNKTWAFHHQGHWPQGTEVDPGGPVEREAGGGGGEEQEWRRRMEDLRILRPRHPRHHRPPPLPHGLHLLWGQEDLLDLSQSSERIQTG